jgi:molybdopterin-guanine dinucleotide biosynthesis protein A
MNRSAVVLAEGFSSRFGQNKESLEVRGKPLLGHVVNAVDAFVDEVIVVTDTAELAKEYAALVGPDVKFAVNVEEAKGLLADVLTGLTAAQGKHCLFLPSDTPFVSPNVVELLFDLCHGKTAVIPRWPNQEIEPLPAVYHTKSALEATRIAVGEGKFDLESMVEHLGGVRYLSTLVLQELDPDLKTFFTVNSPVDLKMAETFASPRKSSKIKKR